MVTDRQGDRKAVFALRRVGSALLAVFLPAACALSGVPDAGGPLEVSPAEARTLAGSYLGGLHAMTENDPDQAIRQFRAALEQDPQDQRLQRRLLRLYVVTGRFDEAAMTARQVAEESNEETPVAGIVLAVEDVRRGRFASAAERLAALPENGFGPFIRPLLRAWVLAGDGQTDAALEALDAFSGNNGLEAHHALHAALINELAGRLEVAEAEYLKVVEAKGTSGFRGVELTGAFLERRGRGEMAQALYRDFAAQNRGSSLLAPAFDRLGKAGPPPADIVTAADGLSQALFDLAGLFRQQNARDLGLVFGRLALVLKPDFPVAQMLVADILEAEEQLESANALYGAIDARSPFAWLGRLNMALNLDEMDHVAKASDILRAMAKDRPDDSEPLIMLGNILRSRERFAEAVGAYDEAMARIGEPGPQQWSLLYTRGIALERSKQWERAEKDFLKALEFEPEQPYVLNYLGYSWVDQGMHLERALEMIERAVDLRPNDGYIVDSLGWALYRLGDFVGAVRELERAVELRPEDPVINDHLGDAYWRVGRLREARFQWRRALTLGAEPEDAEKIRAKLEDGLGMPATLKADNG